MSVLHDPRRRQEKLDVVTDGVRVDRVVLRERTSGKQRRGGGQSDRSAPGFACSAGAIDDGPRRSIAPSLWELATTCGRMGLSAW